MARGGKVRGANGRYVVYFKGKGSEGKPNRNKLLQKYCNRPKTLSKLIKAVIVLLAITEILRSIFPLESPPFPVKWMVIQTLLKNIHNQLFDTRESDFFQYAT